MSNWTHEQLTTLGYHRHPDGNYYPTPPPPRVLDSIPKHDPVIPLVTPPQTQTKGKKRVTLRIERVSTKLQDFDNFVGGTKPLTDQLRYSGLIHDDDPESINANYSQQRCKHRADEKTIIEIIYHPEKPLKQRQDAPQSLPRSQAIDQSLNEDSSL
jgi:hypothetical protein